MDIEKIGVSSLENYFANFGWIKPFFDTNDKTPSWDGYMILYSKDNGYKKENIKAKIDVQIKSQMVDSFSEGTKKYLFEKSDLTNYMKNNGIVLFVIEIEKELKSINRNIKFFYELLTPIELNNILKKDKKIKGKKSVLLREMKVGNPDSLYRELLDFHIDCKKQSYNYEINPILMNKVDSLSFSFTSNERDFFSDLFKRNHFLYGKISNSFIPVSNGRIKINSISREIEHKVIINKNVYFESIDVTIDNEENIIYNIFDCVEINSSQGSLNYTAKGTISQIIKCYEFLSDLKKYGECLIGDNQIEVNYLNGINEDYISFLKELEVLFIKLNIQHKKIDMSLWGDNDFELLHRIIDGIVYNKIVRISEASAIIRIFEIPTLTFAILAVGVNNNGYNLFDFYSLEFLKKTTLKFEMNGNKFNCIPQIFLKKESILRMDNFSFDLIYQYLLDIEFTKELGHFITLFSLELISSYDETNKMEYLDYAEILNMYLMSNYMDKEVIVLNQMQIKKRKENLSKFDLNVLDTIVGDSKNSNNLCGLYILKEDKENFEKYFRKLSSRERNLLKSYPIYKLLDDIPKLLVENNF